MITPALEILNQKGTPMFNSDLLANRPAAGIQGRIFISTDTKVFYRDTGTTWELIGGSGSGTVTGSGTATQVAFWNSASSLTGTNNLFWDATNNRLGINTNTPGVSLDVHGTNVIAQLNGTGTTNAQVTFQNAGTSKWQIGNIYSGASNYFRIYDNASAVERIKLENNGSLFLTGYLENLRTSTASASTGWHGFYSTENITIPANTGFSNVGNIFSGLVSRNTMFYDGNATFAQANLTASVSANNIFNFNASGSTITINQATGTRAFGAQTAFNWIDGTNSGTITHLAGFHNLAPYQGSSGILSVTNYYGLLLNASDERTAFTITNKWGIYQEGSTDKNYLNGNLLLKSNVDSGQALQVTGTAKISSSLQVNNIGVGTNPITDKVYIYNPSGTNTCLTMQQDGTGYIMAVNGNGGANRLLIAQSGAATFSSIVTAGGTIQSNDQNAFWLYQSGNTTDTKYWAIQNLASSGTFRIRALNDAVTAGINAIEISRSGISSVTTAFMGGNVGIGVTPSAWGGGGLALQVSKASLWSFNGNNTYLGNNYFLNSSTQRIYISNGLATEYAQINGDHIWYSAPSGTAGNAITFTQAMTLAANGNLLIGGTVDNGAKLQVNGTASFSNTIQTGAPSGGTAQPFKLGSYVAGITAGTGYVQIEINGTTYKLIAST